MGRIQAFCLIIAGIILVDQFSKGAIQANFALGEGTTVIAGLFDLVHVQNPGAAFGMFADSHKSLRHFLFIFIPIIACFWLLTLIWKSRKGKLHVGLAYSMIFAGAVGNLLDRVLMGHVIDFLDFYIGQEHFPAFNVADSSITIAAGILIYDYVHTLVHRAKAAQAKD